MFHWGRSYLESSWPPLEERFIQTMTAAEGNLLAFFSRPVAAALGILVLLIWLTPVVAWVKRRLAK